MPEPRAVKPVRVAPTRPPPPPTPLGTADKVADQMAAWLRVSPDAVSVVSAEAAIWPDTCLGLPADGEICASVMTPGFAVVLRVADDRYELRTDERAQRIRLVSAPDPRTGDSLVVWRDSRSFDMLIVGRQKVAFGRRGLPLLAAPLAVPERALELQRMLARFAPLQARTPAGEITLLGVGDVRATPSEARMVAEWARAVMGEATKALDESAPDPVIAASSGRAAFDEVVVGRAGYVCALRAGRIVVRELLEPAELDLVYGWLDKFVSTTGAGGFSFEGEGTDPLPLEEQRRMERLLGELAARLDGRVPRD